MVNDKTTTERQQHTATSSLSSLKYNFHAQITCSLILVWCGISLSCRSSRSSNKSCRNSGHSTTLSDCPHNQYSPTTSWQLRVFTWSSAMMKLIRWHKNDAGEKDGRLCTPACDVNEIGIPKVYAHTNHHWVQCCLLEGLLSNLPLGQLHRPVVLLTYENILILIVFKSPVRSGFFPF
jgi:hypothetical protein